MKNTILAGLAVLTLSTSALPALALQSPVGQKAPVGQSEQATNKKYADPNDEQEYQRELEEMNQASEQTRQGMRSEMNRQSEQKALVSQSKQTANKQYADPNDNQEYQRAVEEMNQMFEKHKQAMMTEMNRQLDAMHDDMMRVLSERFKRSREQRLNQ
jgi:type IV secretory pathway VirB10-like protein